MSTGYLTLFYKSNLIESYIRNFLMTKYISLNNAIGANKLISKIKYYHRNYFCFVNKEKNTIRCIIKLNKITNYQIDLKIKSQQELSLNDLKKSDLFSKENVMIQNFFDLEKNPDLIYLNNKINLLIKESNNIYEFNCILLEDSIDMGIFEKIKKCMKDKENNHTSEVQNNLRNNPFISNILSYQALKSKNFEKNGGINMDNDIGYLCDAQNAENEKDEENKLFDMKYQKYFLFDKLLTNKSDKTKQFFDKNKLNDYIDLSNKYNPIFPLSDKIFKNSLEELDNINIEVNDDDKIVESKAENNSNDNINVSPENNKDTNDEDNTRINNDNNCDNKIIPESKFIYSKEDNNDYYNDNNKNQNIFIPNSNRQYNNYSSLKDDQRFNDRYKRNYKYNTFYNNNNYRKYNNNDYYKKNLANNSFSNDNDTNNTTSNPKESKEYYSDSNDNNNRTDNNSSSNNNNNNYRYYHQNNDSNENKFFGKFNKNQYRNSYMNRDNNYFNRKYNDRYNDRNNERNNDRYNKRYDDKFDNRYKDRYDNRYNNKFNNNNSNYDNNKNFLNNNYSNSYRSSNDNSFNSGIKTNYSRSRDRSQSYSQNKMQRYYRYDNRIDTNKEKSYDNYGNKFNDRNKISSNNNYYGDNNNINYYYNINNYYRQGSMGRWKDNHFYQRGGSYQRNKNEHYNNNRDINSSQERNISPERKSEEQNDDC